MSPGIVSSMRLRGLVAAVAALILAGCTASAPPDSGDPPSLAGDWLMIRTVTATDDTAPFVVGLTEQRHLLIDEATCDDAGCTGTLVTGTTVEMIQAGTGSEAGYTWDGETLRYTPEPSSYDCTDAAGAVLVPEAYDVTFEIELVAANAEATAFTGAIVFAFSPASATADQLAGVGCPTVAGSTTFEAQLTRR